MLLDWCLFRLQEFGRGDWIRTSDHLHPMQVRYQAALRPDLRASIAEMPARTRLQRSASRTPLIALRNDAVLSRVSLAFLAGVSLPA
jgi:hypothetical protein